jgi:hypothetical protein
MNMEEHTTEALEVIAPDAQMSRLLELEKARDENHTILQQSIEDAAYRDGQILKEIRDAKLYKALDSDFGRYVKAHWHIVRSVAYELMNYAEAVYLARARNLPAPNCPYDVRRQRQSNKPSQLPDKMNEPSSSPEKPEWHPASMPDIQRPQPEKPVADELEEQDRRMEEIARRNEARNLQEKENQPIEHQEAHVTKYYTSTQNDGRGFDVVFPPTIDQHSDIEDVLYEELQTMLGDWFQINLKRAKFGVLLDFLEEITEDLYNELGSSDEFSDEIPDKS